MRVSILESEEIKTVKLFIEAINNKKISDLRELMIEGYSFINGGGNTTSGKDTMISGWQQYYEMFPDYNVKVDSMHQDGSTVAVFGSTSGRFNGRECMKPENKVGGPAAWRVIVEKGKVKVWQVYADYTES